MSFIYLTASGAVDEEILTAIGMWLGRTFDFPVRRLEALADPAYAFDARRNQYGSTEILHELLEKCPPDAEKLLAITEKDLFIPMLSFVYGQAQLQGKVAVVSLARLSQAFYGFPPNRALLLTRAIKEAVHEVGHTFGLVHCVDTSCPMSLSTNIRQVDAKSEKFCPDCTIYLRESIRLAQEQKQNQFFGGDFK